MTSRTTNIITAVAAGSLVVGIAAAVMAADPVAIQVGSNGLDGATIATPATARFEGEGVTSVRWSIDSGPYVTDGTAPFTIELRLPKGDHRLRARATKASKETTYDAKFKVNDVATSSTPSPTGTPSASPSATPLPNSSTTPLPAPPPTYLPPSPIVGEGGQRVVEVRDTAGLVAALAGAKAGDLINLADGTYQAKDQLEAAADGQAGYLITLRGSRKAIITTGTNTNKGYGLHITGDFWRIEGLTVKTAKKGIILDESFGTVIDGVEVYDIGQEGVHFRKHSANGIIRNSVVHDTGLRSPQFGEGVYVGSAVSNWGSITGGQPDKSDRVLVEANHIYNTPAEGIDIKEGTTGGIVRMNRFDNAGYSGENSADSWIDVKGNDWIITGNTGQGTLLDAFQTHVVASGWGEKNVFSGNAAEGGIPGVLVGIYPKPGAHGNTVYCAQTAPPGTEISNIACVK